MKFEIDNSPATSPHRPAVRAGVVRIFNGYTVPDVATVEAWPHRPLSHARQIARRLHRDAASYLPVVMAFALPGIVLHAGAGARRRPLAA
jgi:hypothetical protein